MVEFEENQDQELLSKNDVLEPPRRNWRQFYDNRNQWLTTPVKVIVGIVIVVALVFLGRYVHHVLKNDNKTKTGSTSQTSKKPATGNSQNGQSSTNQNSSSSANQSTGSAFQPNTTTPVPADGQITNTGPGDTVAIFLAASFGAAALHQFVARRQN